MRDLLAGMKEDIGALSCFWGVTPCHCVGKLESSKEHLVYFRGDWDFEPWPSHLSCKSQFPVAGARELQTLSPCRNRFPGLSPPKN